MPGRREHGRVMSYDIPFEEQLQPGLPLSKKAWLAAHSNDYLSHLSNAQKLLGKNIANSICMAIFAEVVQICKSVHLIARVSLRAPALTICCLLLHSHQFYKRGMVSSLINFFLFFVFEVRSINMITV